MLTFQRHKITLKINNSNEAQRKKQQATNNNDGKEKSFEY